MNPLFAALGLNKAIGWALTALATAALLYGAYAVIYNRGVHAERARWEAKIAAANAKTTAADDKAKSDAAAQRVKDAAANAEQRKDYDHAIDTAKPGVPSDASRRLNCERLRRAGRDTSAVTGC